MLYCLVTLAKIVVDTIMVTIFLEAVSRLYVQKNSIKQSAPMQQSDMLNVMQYIIYAKECKKVIQPLKNKMKIETINDYDNAKQVIDYAFASLM